MQLAETHLYCKDIIRETLVQQTLGAHLSGQRFSDDTLYGLQTFQPDPISDLCSWQFVAFEKEISHYGLRDIGGNALPKRFWMQ